MKKKSVLLITLVLIFSISAMNVAVFGAKPSAMTSVGTAVIDGEDTDGEWKDVPVNNINLFKFGTGNQGETNGTFQAKWDGSSLYLFVVVNDATVSKSGGLEDQDRIQTYIDYSGVGVGGYNDPSYKQYQVAVNRSGDYGQYDCIPYELDKNFEHKVISTDKGYTVEYKLDLAAITGEELKDAHKEIGFDIQISDNDTNVGTRNAAYGWADEVDQAWKDVAYLGRLMLVSSTNAETPTFEPTATPEGTPSSSEPTDGDDGKTNRDILPIIIIVAVAIIVVALVLAYISNKKKSR